ncbi:hypothetical protein FJZ31_26750 [Candidatus Poribacteria bacterium]|nr:hypothetical protein [Candidatus Poribacteria bacterium]
MSSVRFKANRGDNHRKSIPMPNKIKIVQIALKKSETCVGLVPARKVDARTQRQFKGTRKVTKVAVLRLMFLLTGLFMGCIAF